jgi:hypothetical protein
MRMPREPRFAGDFRYESHVVRDRTHLRFFTRKSATRLFSPPGFEIVRSQGINARWWNRSPWRRIAFRLFSARLEEMKYEQFAFVAQAIKAD